MSGDVTQERIRRALAGVLLPLARTLLRCGVSYVEFADLSKRAFVEAASADYGVRNRPTNIARVAVMTGLSRKEVSRVRRERRKRFTATATEVTLPAAVLNEWHKRGRYADRAGQPRVLPFDGSGTTFSSLVRGVTRDIPPGAMRRELVRGGAVQIIDRDYLVPIKRHFVPDSADERVLVGLELGLRRLAETIAFNSDGENGGAKRFQRFAEGPLVNLRQLQRIRQSVQAKLQDCSVSFDDFLTKVASQTRRASTKQKGSIRFGVGLYYYDESN
jgi:hypothetical protein